MHSSHEDMVEQHYFLEDLEVGRRVVYALDEVGAWGAAGAYWWQTRQFEEEQE